MNYDIGEIPRGWILGDALKIQQITKKGDRGMITNVQPPEPPYDRKIDHKDIAVITFHDDEVDKVNRWLDWWRGE